jgi:hypothetical protein
MAITVLGETPARSPMALKDKSRLNRANFMFFPISVSSLLVSGEEMIDFFINFLKMIQNSQNVSFYG